MTKEMWVNLPVKDLSRSKEFFSRIGFTPNERFGGSAEMACFQLGAKKTNVLLCAEDTFRSFTKQSVADTAAGAQMLISLDAESREEVDETARRVFSAGGAIFDAPQEIQGWMYGFGFADLDGHRWNMVFMDFDKLPKN